MLIFYLVHARSPNLRAGAEIYPGTELLRAQSRQRRTCPEIKQDESPQASFLRRSLSSPKIRAFRERLRLFRDEHGPVASEAKHVAEESARLDNRSRSYARRYLRKDDTYHFSSVGDVDLAVLSETDREALDFAWQTFGHYSEFRLRDITHHYPEWKKHAARLRRNGHKRVGMQYADFFDEPDAGYNPCHELSKKDRDIARELYLDSEAVADLWK
jgi:Protein of unknown function (DUF4065)